MDNSQNTEERIFDAAIDAFCDHGYDGTKMQLIADKAEISKASLHYYFRSKDRLFEQVVRRLFSELITRVTGGLQPEDDIETIIRKLISGYISTFIKYKRQTYFIFSEMMKHEKLVDKIIGGVMNIGNIHLIAKRLEAEKESGTIIDISAEHLLVNMISMSVYPIIAEPLVRRVFTMDKKEYDKFLEQRAEIVASFVLTAVMKRS